MTLTLEVHAETDDGCALLDDDVAREVGDILSGHRIAYYDAGLGRHVAAVLTVIDCRVSVEKAA